MKSFFFAVTVSMLLACNPAKAHIVDKVYIPSKQWNEAIEKIKKCKVVDVDIDITETPYGFYCNDWMIYANSDKANEITLIEIEGIKYLPEKIDGKP